MVARVAVGGARFTEMGVTVNCTPLLATPPTVTTTVAFPAAMAGTNTVMLVAFQIFAGAAVVPLNMTVLEP